MAKRETGRGSLGRIPDIECIPKKCAFVTDKTEQNRALVGFHLLQNMNCEVLRRKPVFPASAAGNSLFSLFFAVACKFNLQSMLKSLAWSEA